MSTPLPIAAQIDCTILHGFPEYAAYALLTCFGEPFVHREVVYEIMSMPISQTFACRLVPKKTPALAKAHAKGDKGRFRPAWSKRELRSETS